MTDKIAIAADEHDHFKVWDTFNSRLTWENVLRHAPREDSRQVAQRALVELPVVTAVEALEANGQLVQLLVGRRWYVIQSAREAGATWDDIGAALGVPAKEARDWYRDRITQRERLVPDFHDAGRARAVLD